VSRELVASAEEAVLGALLLAPEVYDGVADLLRPELFVGPDHQEIAIEVLELLRDHQPVDALLVTQRLAARKSQVPPAAVFGLARGVGAAGNVRAYAEVLVDLWTKREARRVATDLLQADADLTGAEVVSDFARRLSAIETRRGRPAQKLAEVMLGRLERREDFQRHPEKLQQELWRTGFHAFDTMVGGLRPGHMLTVAARPGVGKTSFVSAMTDHLASHGVPVGIFQLEDYADSFADRAIMRRMGISSSLMRDGTKWERWHWDKAAQAVHEKADWPIFIDDAHQRSIGDITGAMRRMARERGIRVFILDNLAEVVVDAIDRRDERLDRALGRIAKTYRDAAYAVGACPVLVVHLNRDLEKAAGRPPRMSDIKNSGELEDASHVVALLSREKDSDVLVVDVAKNRNGPTGPLELTWEKTSMTVQNRSVA
jgi:replicative DNA helicase